jgi:hypothetical protein
MWVASRLAGIDQVLEPGIALCLFGPELNSAMTPRASMLRIPGGR